MTCVTSLSNRQCSRMHVQVSKVEAVPPGPMTDFGKQYLPHWIRGRLFLLSPVLLVLPLLAWYSPTPAIFGLAVLLLFDLAITLTVARLIVRFGTRPFFVAFALDILAIALAIQYTGGISGGFATAYVVLALNSILLLGRHAFLRVVVMILFALTVQVMLEVFGLGAVHSNLPLWIVLMGQVFLLGTLLYTSFLVSRTSSTVLARWQDEKHVAETERASAEREQTRWALINNLALVIQAANTPQQVYASIGNELEREKMHCAILAWAEPDVAFRIVHLSSDARLLETVRETLNVDMAALRLAVNDTPELAQAVTQQVPVLVPDALAFAQRLLPNTPRSELQNALAHIQAENLLCAPMMSQGTVTGVLMIWGNDLNASDLAPLAALAQQAASALEKARLLMELRKRAAQLELVNAITTRAGSAENADALIAPLVQQVGEQFGYQVVSILLIDATRNELHVAASYSTIGDRAAAPRRQPLFQGILGLVARTGKPYLARNTRSDLYYYSPHPDVDPVRSELALPLHAQGSILGVMDIESTQPDAFDASDVDALTLLAEQVSTALTKARTLTLEQKRSAQLAQVSEIAARAAASSDPDAIVQTMVQLVQERFGYHHVCVAFYHAEPNEMEQRAAAGPNAHLYPLGKRWNASEGLMGLAAHTRQTVYSGDLAHDPRYLPDPDKVANSALVVPLVTGKNVIGVLDIESEAFHAFEATDIGAMETLANQMAAALEKARSLQGERRRAAQMAMVNRIASRTARLMPTEQLLREAVEMIRAQFGYYNVAVLLRVSGHSGVRLVATVGGLTPVLQPIEYISDGIVGYVAETGATYLCPDTTQDARYFSPFADRARDPVKSELSIPLQRGESVIGVLDIQSEQRHAFTPDDIIALEALADQLAAALENARLFESEAERVAQLDAIRILSLKLTAERDPDTVLESIVASAAELVDADGSTLYIVDEARGALYVRISNHLPRSYVGYRLKLGEGLAGHVAVHGTPLLIEDYARWEGRAAVYAQEDFSRMMGVPLKWQGRVLGVINLHRNRDRAMFNADELQIASLFAAQATIALQNARLLNALETRLQAQQTLSDASVLLLETTDAQAILEHAVSAARRALNCDIALILFPNADGHLVARTVDGVAQTDLQTLAVPFELPVGQGAANSTRLPVKWNDVDAVPLLPLHQSMKRLGYRAGLAVPILVNEAVAGVIAVNSRGERQFDETDIQTLELLANQTASALERARYFVQVQRRVHELNLLFEGYRATASTLEPDQVIFRLLEQLVRALDVTSGYFIRYDAVRQELTQTLEYFSDAANAHERAPARPWKIEQLPEMEDVFSKRLNITHVADPKVSEPMRRFMERNSVYTILRVPLVADDNVLGYLSLWETRAARVWTQDETRFVQTMASQATAALVNAQLYQAAQTRTRELQALHEASRYINTSLDVRAICKRSVDSLCDILGYHHVSIYFLENEKLHMQVQRGYDAPFPILEMDEGIIAEAVRTRETIFLADVQHEPRYVAALSDVQSEIAVPLIAGERVLGALNVEILKGEVLLSGRAELTHSDVQMLTTFANQLVVAIENARLFQVTQQSLVQVRTLHAASQVVNADLKLEAVLERVAQEFVTALRVDFCTLMELDETNQDLVVLFDLDPEPRARVNIGDRFGLAQNPQLSRVMQSGKPEVFQVDDLTLLPAIRRDLERYMCRTNLTLPLLRKGHVFGVIELGDRRRIRRFENDEIQLAESLASQAAVALENARLYRAAQERIREAETLYRFARELGSTLDIHQLGARALESAARLTDYDLAEVCLVRESDGALIPLVLRGRPDLEHAQDVIPRGQGVMGWVAEHGRVVRLGDVTLDPRYKPLSPHIMSEICLPLNVGTRVIGVLNLEAKAPGAFDAHAEEMLSAFASQLAIAIENARLYEQTKRDAEVKATLLRELSHRVKNNLAAITSLLYMALDEPPEEREQILSETLGRVQSMALAHGLLARSGLAQVNLVDLGRQVLNDTVRNLSRPGILIQVDVSGDTVLVGAHQTTTLALILNELATNSLRHGFANGSLMDPRTLRFGVQALAREVECFMEDNGTGLPEHFQVELDGGLGLNLVRTLVEKDLHGRFQLERRAPWTRAEIRFRLADM